MGVAVTTRFVEYSGMSREAASREAERLISKHAADWMSIVDRLSHLKEVMELQRLKPT